MPVDLLPFTIRDLPEALALWNATEGVRLYGEPQELLEACLARNPGLSFIARDGGVLVAAVLGSHDGRRGFLNHLAVAPSHRRRGIARRMVEACLAEFTRVGLPRVHLFVLDGNDEAVAFWSGFGWDRRHDLVMMSRAIP